jgi:hypothetical protein
MVSGEATRGATAAAPSTNETASHTINTALFTSDNILANDKLIT